VIFSQKHPTAAAQLRGMQRLAGAAQNAAETKQKAAEVL
jgi:hypothetical protein